MKLFFQEVWTADTERKLQTHFLLNFAETEGALKVCQLSVYNCGVVVSEQACFTHHPLTVGGLQASRFHQRVHTAWTTLLEKNL